VAFLITKIEVWFGIFCIVFFFAGETKCEIKFINIQEKNKEGYYVCKISVASPFYSPMEKLSAGAMLTVKVPSVNDNAQYNRKCCRTAVS